MCSLCRHCCRRRFWGLIQATVAMLVLPSGKTGPDEDVPNADLQRRQQQGGSPCRAATDRAHLLYARFTSSSFILPPSRSQEPPSASLVSCDLTGTSRHLEDSLAGEDAMALVSAGERALVWLLQHSNSINCDNATHDEPRGAKVFG